jgi:FlaA1/EpsC-like NDP-sugar epimerase
MNLSKFYKGKTILVTGGVGSIGSQLVKKLLDFEPDSIRIFDNNETGLFDLEHELNSDRIRTLIGDVRDKNRLNMAFNTVDIVFHAAALKHVPLCECNPFDAVKTNVIGTQNVIETALDHNIEKVINISTDKAVNPTNVMGATKLLSERLIISAFSYTGKRKTRFSNVRFGNVLNSRGSAIPLFRKQIQYGGPITVTDPQMTRFCMKIPDAVDLIITAGAISQGRETFILKMPAFKIIDLANVMREYYAPRFGKNPDDIRIEIIGKRDGEKVYEELMTEDEGLYAYENENMFMILPPDYMTEKSLLVLPKGFSRSGQINLLSKNADICSNAMLQEMIVGFDIV